MSQAKNNDSTVSTKDEMTEAVETTQGSVQEVTTTVTEKKKVESPQAVALIKGTASDSKLTGEVTITELPLGIRVIAQLKDVPAPGKHGFHIHENGSCDDSGKAAGGHFNPKGVMHGMLDKDGLMHAHAGDMGNITVDQNGAAYLDIFLPGLSLTQGDLNVAGKAIIVHEKEDDFGQPTGNAGGRIGCGIIELKPKQ